jgi:hypothetical protein
MAKARKVRKTHQYYNGAGTAPCMIECEECGRKRQLTELLPGPCQGCQHEYARIIE